MFKNIKHFGSVKNNLAWQSPQKFCIALNTVSKKSLKHTSTIIAMFFLYLFCGLNANANTYYAGSTAELIEALNKSDVSDIIITSSFDINGGTYDYVDKNIKFTPDTLIQSRTINNTSGNTVWNFKDLSFEAFSSGAIFNQNAFPINGEFVQINAQNNIVFKNNYNQATSAYGGAINNNKGNFKISANSIFFENNQAISTYEKASGGAINSGTSKNLATFVINAKDILFINNSAIINNPGTRSDGKGGAIFNEGSFTINAQNSIVFKNNSASNFGGAISNNLGTGVSINSHNKGLFEANYVFNNISSLTTGGGGAISAGANFKNINADFVKNYVFHINSAAGGAIYARESLINKFGNITGDFIGNYASSTNSASYGGAIYNYKFTTGEITGDFLGNYASSTNSNAYGGAIHNDQSTITLLNKDKDQFLSGNYTRSKGGDKKFNALHLEGSTSIFNLNSASGLNLVFNDGITSTNIANKINLIGNGNVIFNDKIENVSIDLQKGTLVLGRENKYTTADCVHDSGGCRDIDISASSLFSNVNLNMTENTTLNTINNVIQTTDINQLSLASNAQFAIDIDLSNSTADNFNITTLANGSSAKLKSVAFIGSTETDLTDILVFNKNITIAGLNAYSGGNKYQITDAGNNGKINIAIDTSKNWSLTEVIEAPALFTRQYIMAENEVIGSRFGVQKDTEVEVMGNGRSIIGNADGTKKDGAIVSAGQTLALNDVASVKGFNATNGAINTTGKIEIVANNTNTTFSDNEGADIVVNDTGEVALKADTSKTIALTGGIAGNGTITKDGEGTLLIENLATTDDFTGKFDLISGTVALNVDANDFFAKAKSFNVYGCMLDLANDSILGTNLGALTLNNNLELGIDVDLLTKTSDNVSLTSLVNNGAFNISIDKINILEDADEKSVVVNVSTDTDIMPILKLNATEINGKIFKYNVSDEELDSLGNLIFNKADGISPTDYNPAVFAGAIATQGAMLNAHDKNTTIVFETLDTCNVLGCKPKQFYASSYYEDKDIEFKNFSNVEAKTYGLIIGANGDSVYYDNTNIKATYGLYVASNNGEYKWDNNKLKQNGLNWGVNAMYDYKNAFFGLSVGLGTNKFELNSEDFYGYSANAVSKIGYNINLTNNIVLTPAIKTSYIYMNVDNYKTKTNASIETSNANVWQISPEIKIQTNLNGYRAYVKAAYVDNIVSGGKISADNTTLPNFETKAYVEYSTGLEKSLNENWSGYANASIQASGQDGYGFNAGLKYSF